LFIHKKLLKPLRRKGEQTGRNGERKIYFKNISPYFLISPFLLNLFVINIFFTPTLSPEE